jgi:hypothetical protein
MRKSIFILSVLFATFANAQITLEHTFDGRIYDLPFSGGEYIYTLGDIFVQYSNGNKYVIDAHTYNATIVPDVIANQGLWLTAKGYLTTDSRICFIVSNGDKTTNETHQISIYDENGTKIQDLGSCNDESLKVFQLRNGEYKLSFCRKIGENYQTEIYSFPGNGEAQAVSTPSSPKRAARKIAREGQVLVETENNTYTLQGQEVK